MAVLGTLVLLVMSVSSRGKWEGPGRRVQEARSLLKPVEPEWRGHPDVPVPHSAHHHTRHTDPPITATTTTKKTTMDAKDKVEPPPPPFKAKTSKGKGKGKQEPSPLDGFELNSKWSILSSEEAHETVPRLDTVAETAAAVYGPSVPVNTIPYPIDVWSAIEENTLMLLVVSDAPYQWWQLRVFLYHHAKVNQPGKLVILMSSTNHETFKVQHDCSDPYSGCDLIFLTGDYTVAPDGDSFVVYNRAHAVREYLEYLDAEHGGTGQYTNIMIVEPDMILLKPLLMVADKHAPLGFHYFYMERDYFWGNNSQLLDMCSTHPEYTTAIGVPYIMHIDDLRVLLPLWIQKTRKMRLEQPWVEGHPRSWIADMWGFACVAADLGWTDTYDDPQLAPEPPIDPNVWPRSVVIHYTYGNDVIKPDGSGAITWRFDKREWYHAAPSPRPYHPLPHNATPLQRLWQHSLNEALVAIYGPSDPDANVEKRHEAAGIVLTG